MGCRGAKTLQVIIPGPNHPAQVKGTVRDKSKAQSVPIEALLMENHKPMQPVAGAIGGAKIRFEGPPGTIEIQSAPTGRFRVLLQPGRYKVHLEAAGYSAQDTQLDVAPRREPIWAEKARLVTPEGEEDITVADFLL